MHKKTIPMIDIKKFGAIGDGRANDTAALQKAIDTAAAIGETLVFSPGTYRCGTLELRSNLTIHLERGATLKGSDNPDDFRFFQSQTPSRMDSKPWRAWLFGQDLENITFRGEGTIDGGGYHPCWHPNTDNDPSRPYGIHLINCRNIQLLDLHLRNSVFWMQRYLNCEYVTLRGLRIWNHSNQNNDAIDIDSCRNVTVSDCQIDAADDGICIKSEGENPACDIVVSNCVIASFASGIKLGTGSVGGFANILINNCVVRTSDCREMHHPLKQWNGLAALDIATVDGGAMRNVMVNNVAIDGFSNAIFVRLGKRLSGNAEWQGYGGQSAENHKDNPNSTGAKVTQEGNMENVTLTNITAHNVGPLCACVIAGYEGNPIRGLVLRDVSIRCGRPGTEADLSHEPDWSPERYPNVFGVANGGHYPVYGLILRDVEEPVVENCRFIAADGEVRPERHLELQSAKGKGSVS